MAEGDGHHSQGGIVPDIIPQDAPQVVDLVNDVSRPAVHDLGAHQLDVVRNGHQQQPVDIVDNLPVNGTNPADEVDTDDRPDARTWFLGRASTGGATGGLPCPTTKDAEKYNMNHRRRGKALIFNHMHFDPQLQLKSRNGTNNDRDTLRITLRQLDFEVHVYDDLSFKDINRLLENCSLEDHSEADALLVAVLSHGELGILYSRDEVYKPERLWGHFTADKCPTLAGKPKMFFIQACQGDQLDSGVRMVANRTETDAGAQSYKIPSHADFLIAYSTIPGFYSWRNTSQGSWFIQALCHVLQNEVDQKDLLSILTRVARRVAFDYQSNVPGDFVMHDKKQIPCITSMLTRDIFFTKK